MIFALLIISDVSVAYLALSLALAEFKDIYLPLIRLVYDKNWN